jgi:hypothetical protein
LGEEGNMAEQIDKRRRKLGYEMPAADLEGKFEELQRLLAGRKAKWGKLTTLAITSYNGQIQELQEKMKSLGGHGLLYRASLLQHWNTLSVLAALGEELSEINTRLANCEKAMGELKLRKI